MHQNKRIPNEARQQHEALMLLFPAQQHQQQLRVAGDMLEVVLPLLCDHDLYPVMYAYLRFVTLICQLAEEVDQHAGNHCSYRPLQNERQDKAVDLLQAQLRSQFTPA